MAKQPNPEQGILSYESAFAELQQIVLELQGDVVSIDLLAARVERASELLRFCRERLRATETEVARLTGPST